MDTVLTSPFWSLKKQADTATGPKPKPAGSPVFIYDAMIPYRNSTLFLELWRAQATRDQDE